MAEPQTKTSAASKTTQGPAQNLKFRELIPVNPNIDFVSNRYIFAAISMVLNIVAIVLFFTVGLNYGVDFRGGTDIRVRFAEPTTAAAVREEVAPLNLRDLVVQDFGQQGREFLLRFDVEEGEEMASIPGTLSGVFAKAHPGEKGFELLSTESVGPKVGAQLRQQGILAVIFATVCMGIYIALRFQWSFGIGAVVALIHDVLITLGALIIARYTFDLTTLAALLTIVGFSVNDTIIVSDPHPRDLAAQPEDGPRDRDQPEHQRDPVADAAHHGHRAAGAGRDAAVRRRHAAPVRVLAPGRLRRRRLLDDLHRRADRAALDRSQQDHELVIGGRRAARLSQRRGGARSDWKPRAPVAQVDRAQDS